MAFEADSRSLDLASEHVEALRILNIIMCFWEIPDAYAEMQKGNWRDAGPSEDLSHLTFYVEHDPWISPP